MKRPSVFIRSLHYEVALIICLILCIGITGNSSAANSWEDPPLLPIKLQSEPNKDTPEEICRTNECDSSQNLQPQPNKTKIPRRNHPVVTIKKNEQKKNISINKFFRKGIFGILVSNFKETTQNPSAKGNQMQSTIVNTLDARLEELGIKNAEVRSIPYELNNKLETHADVKRLGKKYGATIVIWGSTNMVGIMPKITIVDSVGHTSEIIKPETIMVNNTFTFEEFSASKEIRLPVLTQEPTTIVCFTIAHKYYLEKQFDKCLELLNKALPDNLDNYTKITNINFAPIFFYMGNIMLIKYQHNDAIAFYDKALKLDPSCLMALNNRGALYMMQNHNEKALADLDQALNMDLNQPLALNNRGVCYITLGNFDMALRDFNMAINLAPKYADAYFNRADLFENMKQYKKYILDVLKAMTIDPKETFALSSFTYCKRGEIYEIWNEKQKALSSYNSAINLDPKCAVAYFKRANIFEKMGKYEKAIADYESILQINPNDVNAYNNRGNIYITMKKYKEALSDFDNAIKINPKYAMFHFNRGRVYWAIGEYDKAVSNFTAVLEINPKWCHGVAFDYRAASNIARKDYMSAMSDLNNAIDINPNNSWAYARRGYIYLEMNKPDLAILEFIKALEGNGNVELEEVYSNLEIAYYNIGDNDKSILYGIKALKIQPTNALTYYNIGCAYLRKGKYSEAEFYFGNAIKNDHNLASAYYNLGNALRLQAKHEQAIVKYSQAMKLDSIYSKGNFDPSNYYPKLRTGDNTN